MGPPSYMRSVLDRNVVMRLMTVEHMAAPIPTKCSPKTFRIILKPHINYCDIYDIWPCFSVHIEFSGALRRRFTRSVLKKASLSACLAVPEGVYSYNRVIPSHSADIPWPVGSLVMFVTRRSFRVTKAVPLIVVPTFLYVVYPGRLPKLR